MPDQGLLTSSLDIVPTLLALTGCNIENTRRVLSHLFRQALPFPGRDLYHLFVDYSTLEYNKEAEQTTKVFLSEKSPTQTDESENSKKEALSVLYQRLQSNIKSHPKIDLSSVIDCIYFDNIDSIERGSLQNSSHLYSLYEAIVQVFAAPSIHSLVWCEYSSSRISSCGRNYRPFKVD